MESQAPPWQFSSAVSVSACGHLMPLATYGCRGCQHFCEKYCSYLHLSAILFTGIYVYILLFSKKSLLRVFITLLKSLLTQFTNCCCFHHAILRVLKSMTGLVNMVAVSAARVVAAYVYFLHKFFLRLNWLLGHVLARGFAHMLSQFEQNKH